MLRYRTGVAGSTAGGKAIAKYLTSETLRPENEALARYYVGETVPAQELTGMDHLGRAILDGDVPFSAAVEDVVRAHMRMFGVPEDVEGLEERITTQLLQAADRIEMREVVAAEAAGTLMASAGSRCFACVLASRRCGNG
jgi:hypothetical protein